jgi:phage terminase large subunit-like protein
LADQFNIVRINYDRWRINDLLRELEKLNCEVDIGEFGQGYKDMSPAVEEFEVLALNGKIRHGSNPILNMCVSNAVPVRDPAGNRKLDKSKPTGRIAAMRSKEEATETSMYEIMAKKRAKALSNYAQV